MGHVLRDVHQPEIHSRKGDVHINNTDVGMPTVMARFVSTLLNIPHPKAHCEPSLPLISQR